MQVSRLAALAAAALMLGACTTPPVTDSFCADYQKKDFTDPGLRQQNRHNKEADLTNEANRRRKCTGAAGLVPSSERK